MARSRNIKPGFFTNDTLAECSYPARLTFIGLWGLADRAGRLEDRPKRIKAELLPYDECDGDALLDELAVRGFILRYSVGTARYIQVVNFAKHQNPHKDEKHSTIPAPGEHGVSPMEVPEESGTNTVEAPEKPGVEMGLASGPSPDAEREVIEEGVKNGILPGKTDNPVLAPGEYGTNTVEAPYQPGINPADSLVPIPSYGYPRTDSRFPDRGGVASPHVPPLCARLPAGRDERGGSRFLSGNRTRVPAGPQSQDGRSAR